MYLYKLVFFFLFLSVIYPGMEFLDQRVVLFLIFWETSILFSTLTAPIPILNNNVWGFPFLQLLPIFVICVLFDHSHSDLCEVVSCLICTSLMIRVIEHLFTCLLSICISSLEKRYSILPIFLVELFVFRCFCYWVMWPVYICWILILYSPNHLQILLPFSRFFLCCAKSFKCN